MPLGHARKILVTVKQDIKFVFSWTADG